MKLVCFIKRFWPHQRWARLATTVIAGGCLLAQQALAALRLNADASPRIALARFFAENFAVQASALERTVVEGAQGVIGADAVLAQ